MKEIIREQLTKATEELLSLANLEENDIFVVGCSTSEIQGGTIGKNSNMEIGETVIKTLKEILDKHKILLAVQCCEHLNRALVVEKKTAKQYQLEEVTVIPQMKAGGGAATSAYKLFDEPVVVEKITAKAGLDIGDTSIGMHVKFVQVPVRLQIKSIGEAHLTALRSRPKLIGGERAVYK